MTGDSAFSMFNLSLKEEWINNKRFCHRLSDEDEAEANNTTEAAASGGGGGGAGNKVNSVTAEAQVGENRKYCVCVEWSAFFKVFGRRHFFRFALS